MFVPCSDSANCGVHIHHGLGDLPGSVGWQDWVDLGAGEGGAPEQAAEGAGGRGCEVSSLARGEALVTEEAPGPIGIQY